VEQPLRPCDYAEIKRALGTRSGGKK